MNKRDGLSLDRHRKVGARLAAIRHELQALSVEVLNAYATRAPAWRAAVKIVDPIDKLRSALDTAGFVEHSDAFNAKVYYP